MNKTGLALLCGTMLAATPALALEVEKSVDIAAAPAKVWETIGDFCGIGSWHPAVEKCVEGEKDGVATRTLTLAGGGGTLVESLVSRDDATMTYTYKIVDGPLPVANYQSTITVAADDDGDESKVTWTGTFDAKGAPDEKASEVISGIYDAGLKAISEKSAQ